MKADASATITPEVAFPDLTPRPADKDLPIALGAAFGPIADVLVNLRRSQPEVTQVWQYSKRCGWYVLAMVKKRRVFYLIPKHGDFRLSVILGGKALDELSHGPHAGDVKKLLLRAKRYPEGTAFDFDRTTCDPSVVGALLDAKLRH